MSEPIDSREARRLRRSLKGLEQTARDPKVSTVLRANANLEAGRIHWQLDEPESALTLLGRAGEEYERSNDPALASQAADAYRLAAQIATTIHDSSSRLEMLRRALRAFRASGNAARANEIEAELAKASTPIGTGGLPPEGPNLKLFIDLDPEAPAFWETLNQTLDVPALEQEAGRTTPHRLAQVLFKIDELANLWDRTLADRESFRSLRSRLSQNWFLRRKGGPDGRSPAPSPDATRGPFTNLLARSRSDPTESTMLERLGRLQGSCVGFGLRRVLPTVLLVCLGLLVGEIALFTLLAVHSGTGAGGAFPLLTVWPPTAFLVAFFGGERLVSLFRRSEKGRLTRSLWDAGPVRLGIYLVVLLVVEVFWFASDIASSVVFHVPGLLLTSSGPNWAGLLAAVLVLGAIGLALVVVTVQQKAESVRWTTVGGTVAYAGLTATMSLASVGGLADDAKLGFGAGGISGTDSLLRGAPMIALAAFGAVLLVALAVPLVAHRTRRGRRVDRLAALQAYLDDLDALPRPEGEHRLARLGELARSSRGRSVRRALDFAFAKADGGDGWEAGTLLGADGRAELALTLDSAAGSRGFDYFLTARPVDGAAPGSDAPVPNLWERTDLDSPEAWKRELGRLGQQAARTERGGAPLPLPTPAMRRGAAYRSLVELVTDPAGATWRQMLHESCFGTSRDHLVRYTKHPSILLLNEILLRAGSGGALRAGEGIYVQISSGSLALLDSELNRLAAMEDLETIPAGGWTFGAWHIQRSVEVTAEGEVTIYRATTVPPTPAGGPPGGTAPAATSGASEPP